MKSSPLAKKINIQSSASFFYVQFGILVLSEIFLQVFNPIKNATIPDRLFMAFSPKLLVFTLSLCILAIFLIHEYLKPLWICLESGPDRRTEKILLRARMVAVRLPWTLLIFTTAGWVLGIIVFYILNGNSMPSGIPFYWVLTTKLSMAFIGSLINAFIIDSYLKEPKQLLNISRFEKKEVDHFIQIKTILIPLASGFFILTHIAYLTWYYLFRSRYKLGPHSPVLSVIIIGLIMEVIIFFLAWLSKKQDTTQYNLLDSQILTLASSNSADLNKKVSILNFDETGRITESLNSYLEVLHHMVIQIQSSCSTLRENESGLSASMYEANEKLQEINSSIQTANTEILTQIHSISESTEAVRKISSRVQELNSAVIQQNASVSDSSAGIEQMIANISAVTANVERINAMCTTLLSSAHRGKDKISDANSLIGKVVDSSELLLEANKMVASIAAQTNLLAMNAAIEAAHAGNAGAGFAVVADEIRTLAEKSAKQSSVINGYLKEVRGAIENAVTSSNDASVGFDDVLGLITTVAGMEQENAHAMQEQKTGSVQVSQSLHEMQQTTDSVKATATSLSDDSSQLNEAIQKLVECSNRVKVEMDAILNDTVGMNATFEEVTQLKENNSLTFKNVSEQVDRFIL